MRTENGYKTKQRGLIEETLKNSSGHQTVDSMTQQLTAAGFSVGRTTVYRNLEWLVKQGRAQKYSATAGDMACYQYLSDAAHCTEHFHLKCTACGKRIHIECDHINELAQHIAEHHGFQVDKLQTVLYGLCDECAKNNNLQNGE